MATPKRFIGREVEVPTLPHDSQPVRQPSIFAAARGMPSRTDRAAGAPLMSRRRRNRGSGRYTIRRTA